eukprot:jgi/Botrbrau1/8693/Bobra.0311s0008.1
MAPCVSALTVTLVAKPWPHYPAGRRCTPVQKVQNFRTKDRAVEVVRIAAAPASPSAELLRDAEAAVAEGHAVEAFIVEAESNIVPAPAPTRTLSRRASKNDAELANWLRGIEEGEEAARAIVKDNAHLPSSKLQAVSAVTGTAKQIVTVLYNENVRLHRQARRAEVERQQADRAVKAAADTIMALKKQVESAELAERIDILENLDKFRKDNSRLQAEVQKLQRERATLEKKLEQASQKLELTTQKLEQCAEICQLE